MKTEKRLFPILTFFVVKLIAVFFFVASVRVYAASTEVIGDWNLVCDKNCTLAQGLENPGNASVVYSIQLSKVDGAKNPVIQINFPLGIYLPAGIGLSSGDFRLEVPMTVCLPIGCKAILELNSQLKAALEKNDKLQVRFRVSEKKPVEIDFSTKGFDAGLKKLMAF